MIPGYQVLAARMRDELEDLDRSVRRAERAWQAAQSAKADQDMFGQCGAITSRLGICLRLLLRSPCRAVRRGEMLDVHFVGPREP